MVLYVSVATKQIALEVSLCLGADVMRKTFNEENRSRGP